jgi:peptidoglycan/LPS O-acetylase OafA/YrhL
MVDAHDIAKCKVTCQDIMFNNYEINKLIISYPIINNSLIMILFFTIALSSLKRKSNNNFYNSIITDQARGLAIFFLVVGHLWYYVTKPFPDILFSIISDGLSIFLLISGYGISKSLDKNQFSLHIFLTKRINRIMIPYWAATILILLLDYFILERSYKISHIFLTFLGINLYGVMHHFDYVRWYITFLLFWYLVAIISVQTFKNRLISYIPLFFGVIFFLLDYYILKVAWSQFIAFPLGWWLARNEKIYKQFIIKLSKWGSWGFFILVILFIYIKHVWLIALGDNFPSVINELGLDVIKSMSSLCILNYLLWTSFYSRILVFLGRYSYEIFLLHGVFLIKYNPFFEKMRFLVSFVVYFIFIITISWIMNKSLKIIRL